MRVPTLVFAALLFVGAVPPTAANADPIIITGGALFVTSPSTGRDFSTFTVTGDDSSFSGVTLACCVGGLTVGRLASLSAQVRLQSGFPFLQPAPEVVNGTAFSAFLNPNDNLLTFTAEPFLVPPPPSDQFFFSLSTPFTMTGHIAGTATFDPRSTIPPPFLFSVDVTGTGRAVIGGRIVDQGSFGRGYLAESLGFVFESSPAPTPEPATLFLVGSAVVGAAWRRRRRA